MANYDNPNGFRPRCPCPTNRYNAGGVFAMGDLVRLNAAGDVVIATTSDEDVIGVAAEAGVAARVVQVFDDCCCDFIAQCSGTYAVTQDGDLVDFEGTTGIQEINENANVRGVLKIIRHYPVTGSMDIGANSRVLVRIARHQKAPAPVIDQGTQAFENVTASGTATVTGALSADGGLDRSTAAALAIGATNANAVNISKAGTATSIKGSLTVDQAATMTGAVAIGGGYGATGTTLGTDGAIQSDGNLTVGGTAAITGIATFTATPKANALGERTAGSGVTVDGALIKDGDLDAAQIRVMEDFLESSGATLPSLWGTQDTSAAGTPTIAYVDDAVGGVFQLTHDATDEAQAMTLYWSDSQHIDPTKNPIFEARVRLNIGGATLSADQRVVVGLASARNATLDSIASNAWFRIEGANMNIYVEGDDGVTDTNDVDTLIDYVDNTWLTLRIDMSDLAAVVFSIDGVAFGTTVNVSALTAANVLQPYIEIQKDAGTETDRLDVDYVHVWWDRV